MSQETLHSLRLLIPGILLTVVLDPLLDILELTNRLGVPEFILYPIPVFVFGFGYHVLNVRRHVFTRPLQQVTDNIKEAIFQCCSDRPEIASERSFLWDGRKLINVFYTIVDKDPTLSERAKRVRFNGLIWSTLADVQIVGSIGAFVYLMAAAINDSGSQLLVSVVLVWVVVVTRYWLMRKTTERHIALSNYQLELIAQEYSDDVCGSLRKLIDAS